MSLPLLLWAINRKMRRAAVIALILTLVAQYHARQYMAAGLWGFEVYVNPIEQMPVFMLGILAAMAVQRFSLPAWPIVAPIALATAILGLPFLPLNPQVLMPHFVFATLVALATMMAAVHPSRLLANRVMVQIGTVSYSMYLVHFALLPLSLWVAERVFPANDVATLTLHVSMTTLSSFGVASVTYRLIEKPCMQWARAVSQKLGAIGLESNERPVFLKRC